MTAERRLAKLEGALSPKAATLLWLAEAQEFGSLPAYVEWLIDQPISADPLERVPAQARASALEAMRGQPREAVREAAHRAVRDAIFGVELVLKLNVAAEETMRLSRLRYAALFWEMRAISTEAQLETAGPSRAKDGRRTPRWAAWQAAVGSLIGSLYAECTRIALIGERARPEGGDLDVERGTDPAHLAPRQVRDPERLDEVLHPAGADARDIRFLDDREEGPELADPGRRCT